MADVCEPCDDYQFDPAVLEDSLQIATDVLFAFTRYQWPGVCTETVRPCAQTTGFDSGPPSRWADGMAGGRPWGFCNCNREVSCGCVSLPTVRLGGSPLVSIVEVKVDGVALDPSEYRIDDSDKLVRLPGADGVNDGWPCCQRLDLDDTEVGTFSVRYEYGAEPPPGGVASAASLGCQIALARTPKKGVECRLPRRVTSITRQNVTIAVLDPFTLFPQGMTGLAEVDLWLSSVRYGQTNRAAMIVNPETAARRIRRTGS